MIAFLPTPLAARSELYAVRWALGAVYEGDRFSWVCVADDGRTYIIDADSVELRPHTIVPVAHAARDERPVRAGNGRS